MFFMRTNFLKKCVNISKPVKLPLLLKRNIYLCGVTYSEYTQGQSPEPSIREYFYYVNHEGMLFLDDTKIKNFTSCYKDIKFLHYFFKRLRLNSTGRYPEFPFLSLCGRERNFLRCDDCPVVFTHVAGDRLHYGNAGDLLSTQFKPHALYMSPDTGRVYHPALAKSGSVGLVRSKLAIEFSQYFKFGNGEQSSPTHFQWKGTEYELQTDWYAEARRSQRMISEAQVSQSGNMEQQSVVV